MKQDERSLHDPWVRVAESPPEVILQVGDKARVQRQEVVHHHDGLLANQLSEREGVRT